MKTSQFQLILTESNGNYAIPDVTITNEFVTSFSIQNVADISQRKDAISKNITLPGTKNNNRIFNNLYSFNRQSDSTLAEVLFYNYSPNKGVAVVVLENNYPIITGTLRITKISKDKVTGAYTYTAILTGGAVSFFTNIKDKLLTDLTGFEDSVSYTWANITSSWTYADTKKFVFAMIDYGKGIAPRRDKFDLRNIRPGIYLRYYIKAMLASQGYTYSSSFMDSEIFKRIYIPYNEQEFGKTIFGTYATMSGTYRSTHLETDNTEATFAGTYFNAPLSDSTYATYNGAQNVKQIIEGQTDRIAPTDTFSFKRFCTTSVTIALNFSAVCKSNVCQLRISLCQIVGGNIRPVEGAIDQKYYDMSGLANTPIGGDVSLTLPFGNYDAGFTFCVVASFVANDENDFAQNSLSITFANPDAAVGSTFSYELGDSFALSSVVPKNNYVIDVLKSILIEFNMYLLPNPADDKQFIIEPYDTFYAKANNPQAYALDWTKKIDQSSLEININTALPQAYNLMHKSDTDYYSTLYKNTYNENYGDYTILNSNGSADAKDITSALSATVMVQEAGDDKVLPALYSGTILAKTAMKSNLRLLFNNGFDTCLSYDVALITGSSGALNFNVKQAGVTTYQKSHTVLTLAGVDVFNLLFGLPKAVYYTVNSSTFDLPTIYSAMYANQLAEINNDNIFMLACDCHLTEADINSLDLRTPVFAATTQGAAYFKVLSIDYYNAQEVSAVTLQKIVL